MTPQRTTAMDGFEQVKKRPQRFRCTLCAGAFTMDRDAMIRHAKEAEHKSKVKEKVEVTEGWADWNGAAIAWERVAEDWGEQRDADELARWMPSEEELERDKSERDKREWILKWINDVEGARLPIE